MTTFWHHWLRKTFDSFSIAKPKPTVKKEPKRTLLTPTPKKESEASMQRKSSKRKLKKARRTCSRLKHRCFWWGGKVCLPSLARKCISKYREPGKTSSPPSLFSPFCLVCLVLAAARQQSGWGLLLQLYSGKVSVSGQNQEHSILEEGFWPDSGGVSCDVWQCGAAVLVRVGGSIFDLNHYFSYFYFFILQYFIFSLWMIFFTRTLLTQQDLVHLH